MGEAERSGRVHVSDLIATANGVELSGLERKQAIKHIMSRRPVVLGFKVNDMNLRSQSSAAPRSPSVRSTVHTPIRGESAERLDTFDLSPVLSYQRELRQHQSG